MLGCGTDRGALFRIDEEQDSADPGGGDELIVHRAHVASDRGRCRSCAIVAPLFDLAARGGSGPLGEKARK